MSYLIQHISQVFFDMLGFSRTVQKLIQLGASRESTQNKTNGYISSENQWPVVSALELTNDKKVVRALLSGGLKELQELTEGAHQRLRQRPELDFTCKSQETVSWLRSLSLCSDPETLLAELSDPMMRSPLHFAAIAGLEVCDYVIVLLL